MYMHTMKTESADIEKQSIKNNILDEREKKADDMMLKDDKIDADTKKPKRMTLLQQTPGRNARKGSKPVQDCDDIEEIQNFPQRKWKKSGKKSDFIKALENGSVLNDSALPEVATKDNNCRFVVELEVEENLFKIVNAKSIKKNTIKSSANAVEENQAKESHLRALNLVRVDLVAKPLEAPNAKQRLTKKPSPIGQQTPDRSKAHYRADSQVGATAECTEDNFQAALVALIATTIPPTPTHMKESPIRNMCMHVLSAISNPTNYNRGVFCHSSVNDVDLLMAKDTYKAQSWKKTERSGDDMNKLDVLKLVVERTPPKHRQIRTKLPNFDAIYKELFKNLGGINDDILRIAEQTRILTIETKQQSKPVGEEQKIGPRPASDSSSERTATTTSNLIDGGGNKENILLQELPKIFPVTTENAPPEVKAAKVSAAKSILKLANKLAMASLKQQHELAKIDLRPTTQHDINLAAAHAAASVTERNSKSQVPKSATTVDGVDGGGGGGGGCGSSGQSEKKTASRQQRHMSMFKGSKLKDGDNEANPASRK